MKTLLAGANAVNLEKAVAYRDQIALYAVTSLPHSCCPSCQQPSRKVHSRYQRQIADLPWEGISVRLYLSARKFFCLNEACHKRIFCERLPELVAPWGRHTLRLNEALTLIGFALGGRAAARTATALSLSVSPRTLLRRVRRAAPPPALAVRFLGIDDWAMRKGQRYGTILVDLQEHQAIELLPDRDAATLEHWLKDHPGVEVISRDRAPSYIEGASAGAPEAIQVADRFHLVKNLVEALERLLGRHHSLLREAARRASPRYLPEQALAAGGVADRLLTDRRPQSRKAQLEKQKNRQIRLARYEAVKRMRYEGMSISAIGRSLGMNRETVRMFLRADTFPERAPAYRRVGQIKLYADYLRKRWCEGCFNAMQLYREIRRQGYDGCSWVVKRYLQGWREQLPAEWRRVHSLREFSPPRPRQALWWLLKEQEKLEQEEQRYVLELTKLSPEIWRAQCLVKEFQQIVRNRQAEAFDQWRASVAQSAVAELKSFSDGLMKDEAAVRAALEYEWSNGQVEGQVNRLKMVKRQMYGRANFDLLRARFLHPV